MSPTPPNNPTLQPSIATPLTPPQSLPELALKLASSGPVKTLPTPRLIRVLFNGQFIASTTSALFVWEHPYYPQYYLPAAALLNSPTKPKDFSATQGQAIKDPSGTTIAHTYTLAVGARSTSACFIFTDNLSGPAEELKGLAKIDFAAADRWFEEAAPISVHPKDPFKRVDTLPSRRRIQVFVHDVKVADTTASVHLYETGLPCRFYMPLADVELGMLRRSETRTQCPYKGEAEYYSVDVGKGEGGVARDVVWFYERPTLECAKIEGEVDH